MLAQRICQQPDSFVLAQPQVWTWQRSAEVITINPTAKRLSVRQKHLPCKTMQYSVPWPLATSLEAGYWPVVLVGWIVPLGSLSKVYGLSSVSMSSIFLYQVPWYRLHWQGLDRRRLHRAGVARCFWKVSGGPGSQCSGEQEGHCRKQQHRTSCAVERQQNLNSEPWRLPMRGWVRGKGPDFFLQRKTTNRSTTKKRKGTSSQEERSVLIHNGPLLLGWSEPWHFHQRQGRPRRWPELLVLWGSKTMASLRYLRWSWQSFCPALSASPQVTEVNVSKNVFVFIASDGIWDFIDSCEIVEGVASKVTKGGRDCQGGDPCQILEYREGWILCSNEVWGREDRWFQMQLLRQTRLSAYCSLNNVWFFSL